MLLFKHNKRSLERCYIKNKIITWSSFEVLDVLEIYYSVVYFY